MEHLISDSPKAEIISGDFNVHYKNCLSSSKTNLQNWEAENFAIINEQAMN